MKIQIEIKESYGRKVIYPACIDSKIFASLAGTKTLTTKSLELIESLGYNIETLTPTWRV